MNEHVAAPLDVAKIRQDFPILELKPYGKTLVYLDNAASAQKPRQVVDRMVYATYNEYSNVHRGLHYLANAATEAYEAARESVRTFLNAGSIDEIIFTKSATEAINLVASSFGQRFINEGDEIVLSIMEHHANIVPWHFLRERKGAVLKWVDVDDEGNFSLEAFEKALTDKTKIVAITHLSNVLGTVTPIKEIVKIAHARGIPVLVDGAQGAVHLDVDVRDLDVDFYAITGHKLYGPTGVGALYGKKEWLEQLPPFLGGGEMINEVTKDHVTYNDPPHRFEAGTPPIIQAAGPRRRARLYARGGPGEGSTHMRWRSANMRMSACHGSIPCASSAARRTRARFCVQSSRARTRTMSRRLSIARAWRSAPVRIAHSRCWRGWCDLDMPRLLRHVQYV